MKIIILALSLTVLFASCSKKNNNVQPADSNTVTIDGTAYATVKIGSQTWTAVNYNGTGGINYNNSSTNNPSYGKLYTLAEAKAITLPTGWRLPSTDDFNKLLISVGTVKGSDGSYMATASQAAALMAKSTWTIGGGTNTSGFNAYSVGFYFNNAFYSSGTDAIFLSTSILSLYNVPASFDINQDPTYGTAASMTDAVPQATDRASIRFVKDN